MNPKRITLFMGHYGSGKTFTAVNYAVSIKQKVDKVSIYDLDIVNPYFRTVDAKNFLDEKGVELIVSPFAETNVDIPAMNSASYKMISDLSSYAVVDVGGDDRGALALGRFSEKILEENNYDAFLVVNKYRPETRDIEGVKQIIREITLTGKLPFTGIVNNTNLGNETTSEDVLAGIEFCKNVSIETGLEFKFSSVRKDLVDEVIKQGIDKDKILSVDPIKYGNWI